MKKTLITIECVGFISFNLTQKLLKNGNKITKISKKAFKIFVKKYHSAHMILNKYKIIKSFNHNQKIKLTNKLKKYLNWYLEYNF